MTVKDALKRSLLNYPTILPNAFTVYHHWFCVIGNGYDWKDGQLVHHFDPEGLAENKDQAIIRYLKDTLIDEWNEDGTARRFLKINMSDEEDISRYVISHNEDVINDVKRILDIDQRMEDFTVRKKIDLYADKSEFKFYPLSNYSHICNLPDDIKFDWFQAAMKMVEIMDANQDKIEDPENFFPKVKERVKELKDRFHNIITTNGEDQWEILEEETNELYDDFNMTILTCKNVESGEIKKFFSRYVNRLI